VHDGDLSSMGAYLLVTAVQRRQVRL